MLKLGLANYGPWTKSGLPPVSLHIIKCLGMGRIKRIFYDTWKLGRFQISLSIKFYWTQLQSFINNCFYAAIVELNICETLGPKAQKHFLSGSLQKKVHWPLHCKITWRNLHQTHLKCFWNCIPEPHLRSHKSESLEMGPKNVHFKQVLETYADKHWDKTDKSELRYGKGKDLVF